MPVIANSENSNHFRYFIYIHAGLPGFGVNSRKAVASYGLFAYLCPKFDLMSQQMPVRQAPRSPIDRNILMSIRWGGFEVKNSIPRLNDQAFEQFCLDNPTLRIEQDKHGNIAVMPPVSYDSGNYETEVVIDLGLWNRQTRLGKVFSSQTMFILPDGSKRLPDVAWINSEKHNRLSALERKTFARITPDFVIESRSPSDKLDDLKQKMKEVWIANGVRLAWLLDLENRAAWVYKADGSEAYVDCTRHTLSGEDVLPGFIFDMSKLSLDA